jgi:hypothetical protein
MRCTSGVSVAGEVAPRHASSYSENRVAVRGVAVWTTARPYPPACSSRNRRVGNRKAGTHASDAGYPASNTRFCLGHYVKGPRKIAPESASASSNGYLYSTNGFPKTCIASDCAKRPGKPSSTFLFALKFASAKLQPSRQAAMKVGNQW